MAIFCGEKRRENPLQSPFLNAETRINDFDFHRWQTITAKLSPSFQIYATSSFRTLQGILQDVTHGQFQEERVPRNRDCLSGMVYPLHPFYPLLSEFWTPPGRSGLKDLSHVGPIPACRHLNIFGESASELYCVVHRLVQNLSFPRLGKALLQGTNNKPEELKMIANPVNVAIDTCLLYPLNSTVISHS